MGLEHLISNSTFTENSTDIFCNDLSVGPIVWAFFTTPATCVGLPASIWLLCVFAQRQHNGLAINIYMLNVTIMDLMVNIFIPVMILNHYLWRDVHLSLLQMMLFCTTTIGRPLFTVCACFDCYVAAIFPIQYLQMKNSSFRQLACAVVWSVTFAFGLAYVNYPMLVFTPLFTATFALSLSPIVVFDFLILHALRKPDPSGKRDVHPQKIKALQTITFNLVMNVLAYLPPVVLFGFAPLMPITNMDFFCDVGVPACIFPVLVSAIMPLLYLKKLGMLKGVTGCRSA